MFAAILILIFIPYYLDLLNAKGKGIYAPHSTAHKVCF